MYKIHSTETILGKKSSRQTSVFYDTYEEALAAAEKYVAKGAPGIAIFKAIQVVEPVPIPASVVSYDIWEADREEKQGRLRRRS